MRQEQKFNLFFTLLIFKKISVKGIRFLRIGGFLILPLYLAFRIKHPPLPEQNHPLYFYSNQTADDLRIVFTRAIRKAKESLFLQIYGCTDPFLLKELDVQAQKIQVSLFYDPSGSFDLKKQHSFASPLKVQGLMHKKILICDEKTVFLGSANLTPTSLRMHDNLVVGIYHPELAHFITHSLASHFFFSLKGQNGEFWHLPDFQHTCLHRLIEGIDGASHSIHAALFTFTHPDLLEALVRAKQKGVQIFLALDAYSSKGASKATKEKLLKEKIIPYIGAGGKLLHHKWALIDEKTLFLGSANWTKQAFSQNEDFIFVLSPLLPDQKRYLLNLWKEIAKNSVQ